jgi:hypothetical protein
VGSFKKQAASGPLPAALLVNYSFANNFDAQTQKLSTFVLCVCTEQDNIVGREYIHITQKLTIFGSGRQSYLQSCLDRATFLTVK